MRLEGQHGRGPAEGCGTLLRRRDDGPMTAVNAVEIAHGDDGAMQRRIGRAVAHDQKAFSASLGFDWPRRTCAGGRCRCPGAKSTRRRANPAGPVSEERPRPHTTDGCTTRSRQSFAINLIFKPTALPCADFFHG